MIGVEPVGTFPLGTDGQAGAFEIDPEFYAVAELQSFSATAELASFAATTE